KLLVGDKIDRHAEGLHVVVRNRRRSLHGALRQIEALVVSRNRRDSAGRLDGDHARLLLGGSREQTSQHAEVFFRERHDDQQPADLFRFERLLNIVERQVLEMHLDTVEVVFLRQRLDDPAIGSPPTTPMVLPLRSSMPAMVLPGGVTMSTTLCVMTTTV